MTGPSDPSGVAAPVAPLTDDDPVVHPVPTVTRSEVEAALDTALDAFIVLVRAASATPGAADAPVPGTEWTVTELVVHVATLHRRAIDDFRRSSTPEETAGLNARCIEEVPERDLGNLAVRLETDGATAHANLRLLPEDLPFPFHAGTTTTVVPVSGVVLGEYLIHGWELAQAIGSPVRIDPGQARVALLGVFDLIHGWARPGPSGRTTVRLQPSGELLTFAFGGDGIAAVPTEAGDLPDAVDVDVAEFLLAFPYGRTPFPAGTEVLAGRLADL